MDMLDKRAEEARGSSDLHEAAYKMVGGTIWAPWPTPRLTLPPQVVNFAGPGGVAQLVEQRTHKPRVPRSIRGTATKHQWVT